MKALHVTIGGSQLSGHRDSQAGAGSTRLDDQAEAEMTVEAGSGAP